MKIDIVGIANNDNEIGRVYCEDDEYVMEINYWNGEKYSFKTIGCKYIYHQDEMANEIGDIIVNNNRYQFMTVDEEDIILEIEAEQIILIE